jgi:hypothetical protein
MLALQNGKNKRAHLNVHIPQVLAPSLTLLCFVVDRTMELEEMEDAFDGA